MAANVTFPHYAGEYTAGTIITLRVNWSDSRDATGSEIDFEIVRTLSPFTHAVVCVIRPISEPCDEVYFLKMYDRRFYNHVRDWPHYQSSGEYTLEREIAYQRYLIEPDRPTFDYLDQDSMSEEDRAAYSAAFMPIRLHLAGEDVPEDAEPSPDLGQESSAEEANSTETEPQDPLADWPSLYRKALRSKYVGAATGIARFEYLTARMSEKDFRNEKWAYENFQAMGKAGSLAPRLLGCVEYLSPAGEIHGLLLEHVRNAITLRQYLHAAAPCGQLSAQVTKVCNMAWDALGDLTKDTSFWLEDIRHDDILVQLENEWQIPDALLTRQYVKYGGHWWDSGPALAANTAAVLQAPAPRRCVVVDLKKVNRRHPEENDFEWAMNRSYDDEHGLLWTHMTSDLSQALSEDCKVHGTTCWSDPSVRERDTLWTRPKRSRFPVPTTSRREQRLYEDLSGFGLYGARDVWWHLLPPPRGGRIEPIETEDGDSEEEDSDSEESEEEAENEAENEAEEDANSEGANGMRGSEGTHTDDLTVAA